MDITAERLTNIASYALEEKNKILNYQTNIWFKDYFMDILLEHAKKGRFYWTGHVLHNPATGVVKFENYNVPQCGLNLDLIEQKLIEKGFKVMRNDDFVVSWNLNGWLI